MASAGGVADEHAWLFGGLDPGEGDRHFVRELLPRGYSRHVRVLDRWHPAQGDAPRLRWRDLAERAGVEWYAEISWSELREVARSPASAVDLFAGTDGTTRQRVAQHLAEASEGPYFF